MLRLFFIGCLITLISCAQENENANFNTLGKDQAQTTSLELEEDLQMESLNTDEPPPPSEFSLEKGSKIIKNGRLQFEVSSLNKVKTQIDTLIGKYSSYYEEEQYQSHYNRISYHLIIRIPNSKFDSLIVELEQGIGKLVSKNVNAQDVTEEYVDLKIRLDNNLAYLQQYQSILKKATTIKDVLEVQERIRRIEEEIESKKGRLKYLDANVKYSTIHLEISELINQELSSQPNFLRRIDNAFTNGIHSFLDFLVFLVNLWPFLLLLLIIWLLRKRIGAVIRR